MNDEGAKRVPKGKVKVLNDGRGMLSCDRTRNESEEGEGTEEAHAQARESNKHIVAAAGALHATVCF